MELTEDDYDGLLKVMRVLNEVRAKQDAGTEKMFEPLRDIMYLLKEYGVEFPEETYEQVTSLTLVVTRLGLCLLQLCHKSSKDVGSHDLNVTGVALIYWTFAMTKVLKKRIVVYNIKIRSYYLMLTTYILDM